MKYLIMIYSNPATWAHSTVLHQQEQLSPAERADQVEQFRALMTELVQSDELISTAALDDPARSRTIRLRDGELAATDGPFTDAKEQLAGYFLVECATPERAAEIAGRFPDARYGGVEIRSLVELSEIEM